MDIVGRWHGYASQAILGQTPFRIQKPGVIADLVIEPNGKGYTEQKKTFGGGTKKGPFTYEFDSCNNRYILYNHGYGGSSAFATLFFLDGDLVFRFADDFGFGQSGCCMFYKRG